MVTNWRVNGSGRCQLLHRGYTSLNCGPFTATSGPGFGTNAASFSSTLNATATPELDGTLIECFGPGTNGDLGESVGAGIIHVLGQ